MTDQGLAFARSSAARPLRFVSVGGATFLLQVALLRLFELPGLAPIAAYALALAVAVQFNFVVSQLLVWHDRPLLLTLPTVAQRWASFHGWIAFSLVVNLATFALALLFVSDIAATVVAVATSTVIKFVSLDRLTFRAPTS